ncbi:MAG TPA: hypothetical protein VFG93_05545 [Gaiellaceae bacterium]|nr:hypothetical protein [Gaiellaceae bacterium]
MATAKEEGNVVRSRNTILGIALGLAIAAIVPMTALAKPVPANNDVQDHGQYQLGPGEIPVLGPSTVHAQAMKLGLGGVTPDDRSFSRATNQWTVEGQTMELGISEGKIRELGLGPTSNAVVAKSPDDRSFSRATSLDPTPVVVSNDNGRSIDINAYTVTGFGLALLLLAGFGLAIAVRQSHRTKLSPA